MLEALLKSGFAQEKATLILDARMPISMKIGDVVRINRIPPTVFYRLQAEWWLARHVKPGDVILCFGNLPPIFKLTGRVVVFVQNKYLLVEESLSGFPLKTRVRLSIERLWFKWRVRNANQFIVQTPAMKTALEERLGKHAARHEGDGGGKRQTEIQVLPFVNAPEGYQRKLTEEYREENKKFDFLYVASGEPHKNHRQLIEAWCLLAREGVFPSLKLTLDRTHFAELCFWMEQQIERYRLHVENLGSLPHERVLQLYGQAGALIYPSTFESFGVPLIEARQAGLPVLAAELDYVRDVLDPEQTFDPESAVSIARAVKRFLGVEEQPLPLLDATQFMASILKKAE